MWFERMEQALAPVIEAIASNLALAGAITVLIYALGFIAFGAWRDRRALATALHHGADGMVHLRPIIRIAAQWLVIPAAFVVAGVLFGLMFYSPCAGENPGYCTSPREAMCLEEGSCEYVTVRDSETREIRTLATLGNAIGKITVVFQLLFVVLLFAGGTAAIFVWIMRLTWRVVATITRCGYRQLLRIPIRM